MGDEIMSLTVGVDIGGTKIAAGVVDEQGKILTRTRRRTPSRDLDAVQNIVIEVVNELAARHTIEAVGVGTAGFIDATRSRVMLTPRTWDGPMHICVWPSNAAPTCPL